MTHLHISIAPRTQDSRIVVNGVELHNVVALTIAADVGGVSRVTLVLRGVAVEIEGEPGELRTQRAASVH